MIKVINKIDALTKLIKSCPELFHDGIDGDILGVLREIKQILQDSKI